MSKYKLKAEDFNFHPSELYPEIDDFFGGNTFIKCIAMNEATEHYWYNSIKYITFDDRISIRSGVFQKGKSLEERDWPKEEYNGLISTDNFARDLLMHLFGTTKNESVAIDGKERLEMECEYYSRLTKLQKKTKSVK